MWTSPLSVPDCLWFFSEALDVVRRGGKVIEVGHYTDSGDTQIRPHQICNKDLDVCGVWAYPQIQFQTALDYLQITRAPLHELITHHLPLYQLEKGIDMLGQEGVYKVVIEPQFVDPEKSQFTAR